jgi:hypothetical protein
MVMSTSKKKITDLQTFVEKAFLIEEGNFYKKSGGRNSELVDAFIEKCFKLNTDRSNNLYLSVILISEKEASNLVNTTRRRYTDDRVDKNTPKLILGVSKVYNDKKEYLGLRVWRIA